MSRVTRLDVGRSETKISFFISKRQNDISIMFEDLIAGAQSSRRCISFPSSMTPLDAGQGRRRWKRPQQLSLRKRYQPSTLWLRGLNKGISLPEGLSRFAFRRPCPVECEAYSSGVSEKQKKQ